jgi:hypothetical protein
MITQSFPDPQPVEGQRISPIKLIDDKDEQMNANDAGASIGKHSRHKAGVIATLAMALLATVAAIGVSSQPAEASAFGCSYFRPLSSPWGTVPVNSYCARLDGTGRWVNYVSGSFTINVGTICNYNITAEFFDSSGRWYMTKSSPVQYRCDWGTRLAGSIPINQNVQRGFMCSTLKQNGGRVTSVCHNIY